jgi:DNA-binding SARP family transcriptional activator/tetratricopeptide (TPR) repeat protein
MGAVLIEFRVLGPVEVWAGGRLVDAGQPRQRAVLAALLADAGRAVPVESVIDRVWGEEPPRGARASLQAHITRIRQVLEQADRPGGSLVFAAGCYRLDVDPAQVDLHLFRQLTEQARSGGGIEPLRRAVRLWRGEPLAGLRGPWVEQARQAWGQERLTAAVAWAEAELRAGDPAAVVPMLSDLTAAHPLTESLAAVLIRALAATGRPAEALAHYETVRRRLIDDLGTDPSAELQAVYRSILQGTRPEPGRPEANGPAPRAYPDAPARPAQLPTDLPSFAGRSEHLARLTGSLREGEPTTLVIHAVSGMAGVGKTTLAVHWAHRVVDRFPDGQLYVNLRGFDPAGRVLDPADAVRGFLDALGVPQERIPAGLDAQAALYRSLLAGKRMLVLLDNARDAEQVRPLLPATAGVVAVVTSRNRLTSLVAAEGARPVMLDVLSDDEAADLLRRRLGAARADAEPDAVAEIVAACAGLPLALAIAAAWAQENDFPLAVLAAELDGLDALDARDPAVQVRNVFSWSYAALVEPLARLFRRLGLHPGPDISAPAAAALAGLPLAATRRLLSGLVHANLLTEPAPGRYNLHDLLRDYAADLAATIDPDEERAAAGVRLRDFYVHSAHAADRLLYPARDPIDLPLGSPAEGVHPEVFADHQQAMAWLTAEHPVLLGLARHAAEHGHDVHAWQLAWSLDTFLLRHGHRLDRLEVWTLAAAAADRLGDLDARACAHRSVGRANIGLRRFDDARAGLGRALDLSVRAGNVAGQANVHNTLANLNATERRFSEATVHARQALALYETVGNVRGQALALSNMGWNHAMSGDYPPAIEFCRKALAKHEEVGDRRGAADVWDTLGYAHHHLGDHAEALDCFRHGLDLVRDLGDRHAEAEILVHLGDTHDAFGDRSAARAAWQDALRIFDDLEHVDAAELRAKLAA